MRLKVLAHFSADPREWTVVFTSGTTASLKMVGEQFPWSPQSTFVYARESHNSVLGVREYARAAGAGVRCVDLEDFGTECDRCVCCMGETVVESAADVNGCIGSLSQPGGGGGDACVSCPCSVGTRTYPDGGRGGGDAARIASKASAGHRSNIEEKACQQERRGIERRGSGRQATSTSREEERDAVVRNSRNPVAATVVHDSDLSRGPDDNSADGNVQDPDDVQGIVDCLLAFPAECNATGARPDLSVAGAVKRRWGNHGSSTLSHLCRHGSSSDSRPCGNSVSRKQPRAPPSACVGRAERSAHEVSACTTASMVGTAKLDPDGVKDFHEASPEAAAAAKTGSRRLGGASDQRDSCVDGCGQLGQQQRRRWWVMLDAAKFVGTAPLDLSNVDADFVALSFYKMFG